MFKIFVTVSIFVILIFTFIFTPVFIYMDHSFGIMEDNDD